MTNQITVTVDFRNHTVSTNNETCNFYEAGIFEADTKNAEPNTPEEFSSGDFDNHLWESKYEDQGYSREDIKFVFIEKTTTTMAIITTEDEELYLEEKHIRRATFEDFMDCDWSFDDMGLEEVGENENGDELYTSVYDFEGKKTWKEIMDISTDWFCVPYWDGNNWKVDVYENYSTEEMIIERDTESEPDPVWSFCYKITRADGSIINATQSNCSGSISPYYFVEEN